MKTETFHNAKKISPKPTVLVAGGAGFIGAFLSELLLLKKCRVIAVDNLLTGKKDNLKKCFEQPDFSFINHDLTKPLEKLVGLDYIFHLAGLEIYIDQPTVPLEVLKVNAQGTINLLKLAQENQAKFLLGSSLRIYEASFSDESLNEYFGQEQIDLSFGSLSEGKRFAEAMTTQYFQNGLVDARVVRLGYLYGPRMNLKTGGELSALIKAAVAGEPLKVVASGQKKIYPTFVSDVVYGLSKAMFSSGTGGKIFSLVNLQAVSLLDFAQEIKLQSQKKLTVEFVSPASFSKNLPLVDRRNFSQEKIEADFSLTEAKKSQSDLNWKAKVDYQEGLGQTLAFFEKKETATRSKPVLIPRKKSPLIKRRNLKTTIFAFCLLLLILFSPLIFLGFNSFWGIKKLKSTQKFLLEADFAKARQQAQSAQKSFSRAKKETQFLVFFLDLVGQQRTGFRLEKLFSAGEKLSQSAVHLTAAAESAVLVGKIIFQNQTGNINKLANQIKTELALVYDNFSLAEAEMGEDKDLLPVKIPFAESKILFSKAIKAMEILPKLIGVKEKKVYLILLQNNMELRPTGGFIGSFALATFDQGSLVDFKVEDVYQADGQLKGYVAPPEALKKHLGEASWFLRDSNWDPDFPTAALKAEWFLEKEIGRSVDGVIGVDLFLAQNILKQIGELELVDFKEKINYQNLFERAEYQAEIGFFPGSTQKKDFLGSLARSLLEKIKNGGPALWFPLGQAVYQSLNEKDFLVYLNDFEAMKVFADLGWDGAIREIDCDSTLNCYFDYLMMVEANVGVNKANYFIKRDLIYRLKINKDGSVDASVRIFYQNQSESEVFPAGNYKNYLRFLTPKGSRLKAVLINGRKLDRKKIDQTIIANRKTFGFLVNVPIRSSKKIEIQYQLAKKINFQQPTQYLLLVQKQPGVKNEAFNFEIKAPSGVFLFDSNQKASRGLETLFFSPKFDQDLVLEASIIK